MLRQAKFICTPMPEMEIESLGTNSDRPLSLARQSTQIEEVLREQSLTIQLIPQNSIFYD
jgi:hypothetical protein